MNKDIFDYIEIRLTDKDGSVITKATMRHEDIRKIEEANKISKSETIKLLFEALYEETQNRKEQ